MKRLALLAAAIVLAAPAGAAAAPAGTYDGYWDAYITGSISGTEKESGKPFTQKWCCGSHFFVKGTTVTSHLIRGTVSRATGVARVRWEYHSGKTCPLTLRLRRGGTWRAPVRCTFVFPIGTFPFVGTVTVRSLYGP